MSIRIAVLGSGSSGNCTFLSTGRTKILIDAGFSLRAMTKRLASIGETPDSLDAVLITHEHSDHVSGLGRLTKQFRVPVYITPRTRAALPPPVNLPAVETIQPGQRFQIADLTIEPFTIPHDAVDPVGFRLSAEGLHVAHATDLGYLPENVKLQLRGCHFMVLESNHDLEMLRNGPYPWHVKQRVMARTGHLSNSNLGEFLRSEYDGEAQVVVLAHLSNHNNHPEIARTEAAAALDQCIRNQNDSSTRLVIARQDEPSEIFEF